MKLRCFLHKAESGEMHVTSIREGASDRCTSTYDSFADMRRTLSNFGYGYEVISKNLSALLAKKPVKLTLPEIEIPDDALRVNGFTTT